MSPIPTLVLYASGLGSKWVAAQTALGVLRIVGSPPASALERRLNARLAGRGYSTLSYMNDWLDAFEASPHLDVFACDVTDRVRTAVAMRALRRFELVVVLHSAFGDHPEWLARLSPALEARRAKLLLFVGNEYNLMPRKLAVAKSLGADFIATQLPLAAAQWLYAELTASRVLFAPAALNPHVYRPLGRVRTVDVGFRGDRYSYSIGDVERTTIVEYFKAHAEELGISADVEYGRVSREEWALFLNGCRAIVGAESGTYYLERDDRTQNAVLAYLRAHPGASFEEVHARFFADYQSPISGKTISSRHFEPIGTKTCQILLEGEYAGVLREGEHYIGVKKDLSNAGDAIAQLRDEPFRRTIVEHAYEHALASHTYERRVADLVGEVFR